MRAADLKRSKLHSQWVFVDGSRKAVLAFDDSLTETLTWAARETEESDPEKLMKFMANYFVKFSQACPSWNDVLPEIVDGLQGNAEIGNCPASRVIKNEKLRLDAQQLEAAM